MNEWSVAGKVQGTWNKSFRECTVLGGKDMQCLFVSGTKVPGNEWSENESSIMGTNVPGNE